MPSIDVAMARSVRGGFLDLLTASMRPVVESRDAITDVQGHITDVKTAFSSWDNCMNANFCKYVPPSYQGRFLALTDSADGRSLRLLWSAACSSPPSCGV